MQRFRCFYSQNTQKKDQSDDADENDPSFFTSEFQLNGQHHSQEKQYKWKKRQRWKEQVCQGGIAFYQLNNDHQQCGNKPGGSSENQSETVFFENITFSCDRQREQKRIPVVKFIVADCAYGKKRENKGGKADGKKIVLRKKDLS